jgi:hypothetical protein
VKFLSARLIQPEGNGKDGKYVVAVEVTGKDINRFEDMAMCYMVNGRKPKSTLFKKEYGQQYDESHELTPEYNKFTRELWKVFHMPWKLYDTCGCVKPSDLRNLSKNYDKYEAYLGFDATFHKADRMVLDRIKKAEDERKAKLPPEKPWVEDPVAKEQHRILKKYVPKTASYYMHCENNKIMGPFDEVTFYMKHGVEMGFSNPTATVRKEHGGWTAREIIPIWGKFKLKVHRKSGTFEECVIKAIEVM